MRPFVHLKALSTLATIVAEFGDYSRRCGQGFTSSIFPTLGKNIHLSPFLSPSISGHFSLTLPDTIILFSLSENLRILS